MEPLCAFCLKSPATVRVPFERRGRDHLVFACADCARLNRVFRLRSMSAREFLALRPMLIEPREPLLVVLPAPLRPMTEAERAREGRMLPDLEPASLVTNYIGSPRALCRGLAWG